jgi:hypothetical protein
MPTGTSAVTAPFPAAAADCFLDTAAVCFPAAAVDLLPAAAGGFMLLLLLGLLTSSFRVGIIVCRLVLLLNKEKRCVYTAIDMNYNYTILKNKTKKKKQYLQCVLQNTNARSSITISNIEIDDEFTVTGTFLMFIF